MARSVVWRRHRRAIFAYVAAIGVIVVPFGAARITAVTTGGGGQPRPARDVPGSADLFDDTFVHEVAIEFDEGEYDEMIEVFRNEGEKGYVQADVTIDGTVVESVGVRLKGNSTLFGLSGENPLGDGPSFQLPGSDVTASEPERLPWLIRFDEFVDGQRYQDLQELAVRPAASFTATATSLTEAVALRAVGRAGQPTQASAYSSFTVNGGPPQLRLLVEHPGERFADDALGGDGVLYKSRSTGRFGYLGEDPLEYDLAFKQVTREGQYDLAPLISFTRWVATATDEEFSAGLADRVDVDALAAYVALANLLVNFDDMSGPGNNAYYWYDLGTDKFTVVSWDLNSSLFGSMNGGPFDPIGIAALPIPGLQFGNQLKDRFLAEPAFAELYLAVYQRVFGSLFDDGWIYAELDRMATVVATSGLLDQATVDADVATLRAALQAREAFLSVALGLAPAPVPTSSVAPEDGGVPSTTVAGSASVPEAPTGFTIPAPGTPEYEYGGCIARNGGNPMELFPGSAVSDATAAAIEACADQRPASLGG